MIAIRVLQEAQQRILESTGTHRQIRCFFSEINANAFAELQDAVAAFHKPQGSFEIKTYQGKFEDAVDEIQRFYRKILSPDLYRPDRMDRLSLQQNQIPFYASKMRGSGQLHVRVRQPFLV
jgi:hypothetical protein